MRKTRLISGGIGIALILSLFVGTVPASAVAGPVARARRAHAVHAPSRWTLYLATNASRVTHGVHRVWLDPKLSAIAMRHSRAMAASHSLYHTPNPNIYLHGVSWSRWGENVGFTTGDATDLQTAFMNSVEHRDNILDRRFSKVGVGVVKAGGKLWVTVFFYG